MTTNERYLGYIGTYTKGDSEGIYSFILDAAAGKITDIKPVAQLENPTYLTVSDDNKFLYSVAKQGTSGGVASFAITESAGLSPISTLLAEGASPCHVSVDNASTLLLSANYHMGTADSYSLDKITGRIQSLLSSIHHEGSGPDHRQEKAHTHYAGFTPDGNYVAVVDLGIDQLITYALENGKLIEKSIVHLPAGSGPRHLAFHPNGKVAYLMTEFSSEVIVLRYRESDGSFEQLQAISTLPESFTDLNQGSAIHLSKDGKFVYAANRGHNSIAAFKVDLETFELSFIGHTSTEGDWPRDFSLDPSGKFLLASNQESSSLVLFSRDEESGKLSLLQNEIKVPHPVCIKFLNY